jgi:DNA-binding GntR family transcriptional regulator
MPKQVMQRAAADNVYLHKDFHGALSAGIEFLHRRYGAQAVREYLRQFARAYYAPLSAALRERGLVAMKEHLQRIYEAEGGRITLCWCDDAGAQQAASLLLEVEACPAVTHMRQRGYAVAELFRETTRTVYEAICEDTPFAVEVLEYDDETGRSRVRFYRRAQ